MTPSIAATIRSLDSPPQDSGPFRLGAWLVRPDRHCIVDRSGRAELGVTEQFHLEPRVMELLVRLSEADGEVVSKEELVESVWEGAFVSDSAITRAVSELRRALGDSAQAPRYIETIPKKGYRLVMRPQAAGAGFVATPSQPEGRFRQAPAKQDVSAARPDRRPSPGRMALLLGAAVLFSVGLAAVFTTGSGDQLGRPATRSTTLPMALPMQHLTTDLGLEVFPSWSPDGQRLAYASDRSGSFELYVRHLVPGGAEIQLTDDGAQNVQAAWSPDGNWIAYHSLSRGGLWLVSALGGEPRRISGFGSAPSWAPDSRRIAYQVASQAELMVTTAPAMPPSNLWIIDVTSGEQHALTEVGQPVGGHGLPQWSPSGERIAFISWSPHFSGVWTVASDGSNLQAVELEPEPSVVPDRSEMRGLFGLRALAWTPAGDGLYVSARMGSGEWLWRQPLDAWGGAAAGAAQPLVRGAFRHVAASSRGELALTRLEQLSNLWSVPIDAASGVAVGEQAAFTTERNFRTANPRLSPDGSQVVYRRRRIGEFDQLRLVGAGGGRGSDLTLDPERGAYSAFWRPDGRSLIFSGWRNEARALLEIDVESRQVTIRDPLPPSWGKPVFDDQLQWAAFDQLDDQGHVNVFMLPFGDVAGDAVQVTNEEGFAAFPKWSPDARHLAVEVGRPTGTQVAVVARSGGALRQLTDERGAHWPGGWSLDGRRVLFTARRAGRWSVRWVDVDSGEEQLIAGDDRQNVFYRDPIWLPDRIVYERGQIAADLWRIRGVEAVDS